MSSVPLFVFGCVVFVIVMTAMFLVGLTQFSAWEHRDDEEAASAAKAKGS